VASHTGVQVSGFRWWQDTGRTGCSLQEAIYSANFDDNLAIGGYDFEDGTPHGYRSGCVAGSGDDV